MPAAALPTMMACVALPRAGSTPASPNKAGSASTCAAPREAVSRVGPAPSPGGRGEGGRAGREASTPLFACCGHLRERGEGGEAHEHEAVGLGRHVELVLHDEGQPHEGRDDKGAHDAAREAEPAALVEARAHEQHVRAQQRPRERHQQVEALPHRHRGTGQCIFGQYSAILTEHSSTVLFATGVHSWRVDVQSLPRRPHATGARDVLRHLARPGAPLAVERPQRLQRRFVERCLELQPRGGQ